MDEKLPADAVALAIAGSGERYLEEADGLWYAIGWYAALIGRVSGTRPRLSEDVCGALASIPHPEGDPPPHPESRLNDGISREPRDGRSSFFPGYEKLLSETPGVWRELSRTEEDGTSIVAVTDHLEDRTGRFLVCAAFAAAPGEGLPGLVYLTMTEPSEEKEPDFTPDETRDKSGTYALTMEYGEDFTPFAAEYERRSGGL